MIWFELGQALEQSLALSAYRLGRHNWVWPSPGHCHSQSRSGSPWSAKLLPNWDRTRHARGEDWLSVAPKRGLGYRTKYGTSSAALFPLCNPKTLFVDKQGYQMFSQHLNTLPQGSCRTAEYAYTLWTSLGVGVSTEEMPFQWRSLAAARHWGECLNPKGPRGAQNSVY